MAGQHPRTQAVHSGTKRSQYGEVSEALFLTQGFVYDSAEQAAARFEQSGPDEYIYARYGNPTVAMFEERMAALEGAEDAFATGSGMAAVNGALFSQLRAGDHVVSSRQLFGSCLYIIETLLPRFGVDVTLVDGTDLAAWDAAVRPDTKVCFLETVSNPVLEVMDLKGISEIAHRVGACVVVDNVFATPVFQRSFDLGADVVIYSTTKHVDGQGRCLGGIALSTRKFIRETFEPYLKHTGGAMNPFAAWVMLKGLETMDLRVRAQADTALFIAEKLADHSALDRVLYPHAANHPHVDLAKRQMERGGTVVSLDLKGGRPAAFAFLNALEIVTISNNLGDAKSIATHPSTTTHQRLSPEARESLGITEGLVRVSIGLEHQDDLFTDIQNALLAVSKIDNP